MFFSKISLGVFSLLLIVLSFTAFANEITNATSTTASDKIISVTSKIVKISNDLDSSLNNTAIDLYLENGMIATLKDSQQELIDLANKAKEEGSLVNLVLIESDFAIYSFDLASKEQIAEIEKEKKRAETLDFIASLRNVNNKAFLQTVISVEQARRIFSTMHTQFEGERRFIVRKPSQCFRRAQVWSYEMETINSVESRKYFLMFTGKYRSSPCKYKWWFHVTPYVRVQDESGNRGTLTMDRTLTNSPMSRDYWAREFVHSQNSRCQVPENIVCPVLDYNQYDVFQREYNNHFCMIFDTSRFYYYPTDMEKATFNRIEKNEWNMSNIQDAYIEKI